MNEGEVYRPLASLLSDMRPTVDDIKKVIKSAARKTVPILNYQEARFYDMLDRAGLNKKELSQIHSALESAADSIESRNKGKIAEKYRGLATYVYHAAAAE
jgi:hypothetical protein